MQQPRPEPTEPIHDALFDALKADVLKGVEQADAGLCVPSDEMRRIFNITGATK